MRLFSTEQVSKWHPDKYADQISDAILTAYLKADPKAHCGIECMVKDEIVVLGGEVLANTRVNHANVVMKVAGKLGYEVSKIYDFIGAQSPEINNAVVSDENIGAGDQGLMYGYATDETASMLPFGFAVANAIIEEIERDVEHNPNTILKGDAKTQVTVDLDKPGTVHAILVSACHKEGIGIEEVRDYVFDLISRCAPVEREQCIINPSGEWTIGGPTADCGLTGRKIVCDQYGGYCPVGGGAFSGKDPSKVDRSASYMARELACWVVNKFNVHTCEVQLAYAIGIAEPMSVGVKVDNPSVNTEVIVDAIKEEFDLTPKGIIKYLCLHDQDYEKIAEGCHYR